MRRAFGTVCRSLALLVVIASASASAQPTAHGISEAGLTQIAEIMAAKARRTPTENKLDSHLLYGMRAMAARRAGIAQTEAPYVASFIDGNVASDGTVEVTIRAAVSDDLLSALKATGAQDVASFPQFDTITARAPIADLLVIASRADVRFIGLTDKPVTNRYIPTPEEIRARLARYPHLGLKSGSVDSEGVVAHKANVAFDTGIKGAGVLICAISNGIDSRSARQASSDLPPVVYVLSGQEGSGDEGTAMLEIIHDMAPGASLGFATQGTSQAQMATNIDGLRGMGCAIIVDDVGFPTESAFQDGSIAQAINTVTTSGRLHFSSSGNDGNFTHGTSSTWEGDWTDSGFVVGPSYPVQLFGALPYNTVTRATNCIVLQWSDPLGATNNDYDLVVYGSNGAYITDSSNVQNGTAGQSPIEKIGCQSGSPYLPVGSRIVVVKHTNSTARALRLASYIQPGPTAGASALAVYSTNSTSGHSAAASAITVAAVKVPTAGGAFVGGVAIHVEDFSSDGPRKMFYNPNGTAITPGNVLFGTGGGTWLQKVDIAAADGVTTAFPIGNYNPFPGTSAAAPHAAAIAALAWSAKPTATAAAVKAALFASALDIEAAGVDRDSGVGIVMADASVRAMLNPISITKSFNPPRIAPGGASTLSITLTNSNAVALQNVAFINNYPPQITNTASPSVAGIGIGCSGTLNAVANGGAVSMTAGAVPAGGACTVTVQVTASAVGAYADSSGAVTTPIALNTPGASATLTVVAISVAPTTLPSGTAGTAYNQTITASGGVAPYAFGVSGGTLPGGLTLASGGTLSGTPTAAGNFNFTIAATDSTIAGQGGPFIGNRAYTINVVNAPASVVTTSSVNPSAVGQTVVFNATLSGSGPPPTGSVIFYDGAAIMCAGVTVTAGQAACVYDALPLGTRSITASYSGDVNYSGATSTVYSQSVTAANGGVLTVSKGGTGSGTVTSSPVGINCGVDCTEPYASATAVTLTATTTVGSTFQGWLGACVGTAPCVVNVSTATGVSATFAPDGVLARLDIDGNSSYNALTDGMLALRYMLGMTGTPLTANAIGTSPIRATPNDVEEYMANIRPYLDIDRDGKTDALTDGLLIIRYLFGLRGDALVAGALGSGATRTPAALELHLQGLTP